MADEECAFGIDKVLRDEALAIHGRTLPDGKLSPHVMADSLDQGALCLSGGGIRSAAFSLGVLQGLAERKLLGEFHYLSTVSGGGYVGSWLQALLYRRRRRIAAVEAALTETPDAPAVRNLRNYTSYLVPGAGIGSLDGWAGLVLVGRNMLINWLLILPVFVAVALGLLGYADIVDSKPWQPASAIGSMQFASLVVLAYQLLPSARRVDATQTDLLSQHIQKPLVRYAWIAAVAIPVGARGYYAVYGAITVAIVILVFVCVYLVVVLQQQRGMWRNYVPNILAILLSLAAGVGALIGGLYLAQQFSPRMFAVAGPPWVLGCLIVMNFAHVLLTQRSPKAEMDREFLARMSAVVLRLAVFWLFVAGISLAATSPDVQCAVRHVVSDWFGQSNEKILGSAFAAVSAISGYFAAHRASAAKTALSGPSVLIPLATLVALVGLLVGASLAADWLRSVDPKIGVWVLAAAAAWLVGNELLLVIVRWLNKAPGPIFPGSLTNPGARQWGYALLIGGGAVGLLTQKLGSGLAPFGWAATLVFVVLVIARPINGNRFSLHGLYRNRIERAFQGSVRPIDESEVLPPDQAPPDRPRGDPTPKPGSRDPFTDFDGHDALRLSELLSSADPAAKARLFPVVNIALNLTSSAQSQRAWAERKAASFTATPLHCGSESIPDDKGFAVTADYGSRERLAGPDDSGNGISLASAVAISGAAVSPNMGYYSAPATAFLMTLFNLRLGAWMPNPHQARSPQDLRRPINAIRALFGELLGQSDNRSAAVYLSDGGHFENLGLYSMIRRGCRTIVVVDGGADPAYHFGDLGNAVRKIQIDLGVEINFTRLPMTDRARWGKDSVPWQVADISYNIPNTTNIVPGKLLYIKACLPPDLPADIEAMLRSNPDFPHDTTANQFFTESLFESYRKLGRFLIDTLPVKPAPGMSLNELISKLYDHQITAASPPRPAPP